MRPHARPATLSAPTHDLPSSNTMTTKQNTNPLKPLLGSSPLTPAEIQETLYQERELARNPVTRMLNRELLACFEKLPLPSGDEPPK